ncbi:MAG: hypothetical protein RKP20_06575 [Candidatus Competibacter sp.]|nr:hypothetical protein [Candidatus Competibacter sp.]
MADDSTNAVPARVRYYPDTPAECDSEALLSAIHQAQTDLELLTHWLKDRPNPTLPYGLLSSINFYRNMMVKVMPSLARH